MSPIPRLLFLLAGLGLSVAFPSAAHSASVWHCIESAHFTVWSDADEDSTRALCLQLETFRAGILMFTGLKPQVAQRISVVCFRSDEEFTPYKPRFNGRPVEAVAGVFSGSDLHAQIALALGNSRRIIFHEYVHALYRELEWDVPLWYNEGSAELFSTFETRRNAAFFGDSIAEHIEVLRSRKLMPLSTLFTITQRSSAYNEGSRQGQYYAESWAFVQYLACNRDPSARRRLNKFLALLGAGRPPDEATFHEAFGTTMADFEQQLDRYIYGTQYRFEMKIDRAMIERGLRIRPAQDNEVSIELAILDAMIHHSANGQARLLWLADAEPSSARVQEALADQALYNQDGLGARKRLANAVALKTTNLRAHWILARALVHDWLTRDIGPDKRIGVETADQIRALLYAVVASNPDAVEAWDSLARVAAFGPKPQLEEIKTVERSLQRWPDDPQVPQIRVLLAFAYHRIGLDDVARKYFQEILVCDHTTTSTRKLVQKLMGKVLAPPAPTLAP